MKVREYYIISLGEKVLKGYKNVIYWNKFEEYYKISIGERIFQKFMKITLIFKENYLISLGKRISWQLQKSNVVIWVQGIISLSERISWKLQKLYVVMHLLVKDHGWIIRRFYLKLGRMVLLIGTKEQRFVHLPDWWLYVFSCVCRHYLVTFVWFLYRW